MVELSITCPCCGREYRITVKGADIAVSAFLDKEPSEQIAQALQRCNLEFGVTGGETE